jgi:hypothetical protein
MKRRKTAIILVAVFALSALMLGQPCLQAQSPAAPGTSASGQSEPTGAKLPSGATINVELKDTLDSKKLKTGDPVKLKTTETFKANGQVVLPKGTQILGHVTQASVKEKGQNTSSLGIVLDKAVLKDGQELPLNATIQAMASGDLGMAAASGTGPSLGTPGPGATTSGGRPGMSGGGSPTTPYPPTPNPGNSPSPSTNIPGSTGANETGVNSAGQLTPASHGVFGMDGITLQPAAGDGAQGSMIVSTGKSVHLSSGTRILLVTK